MEQKVQDSKMSRREFLVGAGGFAAGVAAASVLGGSLIPKAEAAAAVPPAPWPYVQLDPDVVAKKGYQYYAEGGCMYGAGRAIIEALREKVGAPYDVFPLDMLRYGGAGVASWGTLCGALNGACAAVALIVPKADVNKINGELLGWYTKTPFPGSGFDSYAKFKGQKQSVAGSPLCHASVSNWCAASGFKESSAERKDRCAKLTGEVAAKAAEMVNAYYAQKFAAGFKPSAATAECMGCHVGAGSALENSLGKQECATCHPNAHK